MRALADQTVRTTAGQILSMLAVISLLYWIYLSERAVLRNYHFIFPAIYGENAWPYKALDKGDTLSFFLFFVVVFFFLYNFWTLHMVLVLVCFRKIKKKKKKKKKKDILIENDVLSTFMVNMYIQSSLFIPTLDRTTKFVIMTIWMLSRNRRSRGDSQWEIMIENYIKTSCNIPVCFGYLLESSHWHHSKKYPEHNVLWGNKNKTKPFLHIILSIKDSLQQ